MLHALRDEASTIRKECYEDGLKANLERIVGNVNDAQRQAAEAAALEIATAEYEMRTLRNRVLEDRYVYKLAPAKGQATSGLFMGQLGELKVGAITAEYVLKLSDYPDLERAIARCSAARNAFKRYASN